MNIKTILYLLSVPFVIYILDSVRINDIFKKNKIVQARLLYLSLCLCLSYLLVNFFYDFFMNSKIL
ncbi:MAG: DUF1146 domain-containing protein [Bacilli bacterium]|nr:DUF1146 domain-containing protein [Bacilli bacterium]